MNLRRINVRGFVYDVILTWLFVCVFCHLFYCMYIYDKGCSEGRGNYYLSRKPFPATVHQTVLPRLRMVNLALFLLVIFVRVIR